MQIKLRTPDLDLYGVKSRLLSDRFHYIDYAGSLWSPELYAKISVENIEHSDEFISGEIRKK